MKVTVELTAQESETIFYDILCNCISMGYLNGYGLELTYDRKDYAYISSKMRDAGNGELHSNIPTYEEVLMGILKHDGILKVIDVEGDGCYDANITLNDIHTKIQTAPIDNLQNILDETGDVIDCDIVLQHMLYGEIIFG